MKIINSLLLLLVSTWIFAQENNCVRITTFGEKEICLPKIEGYQECYTIPLVKQIADATEVPVNVVLGYYLNDEIYSKIDSIGLINFDNFFKIYATTQLKDLPADSKFLKEMEEVLNGNFISQNWDEMKKDIDKIDLGVKVGEPLVINKYNFNDKSFTYVMLIKYQVDGEEPYTMAMTMNGFLTNERLVWMAYYLNYKGEESIIKLEEQSNIILGKLSNNGK